MSEMSPNEELKFKTSLIFWKLYETGLTLKPKKVQNAFKNDDQYSKGMYDGYTFTNNNGEQIPLKWIASTGKFFLPVCLNLLKSTFHVKNHPQIQGNILVEAHIYPEGVIVMQSRMDFTYFHSINELIFSSVPSDVILPTPTEHDMKAELDRLEEELLQFLIEKLSLKQRDVGEKASPWHHNWIWWENSQQIPNQAFDIGGTHFTYALGMCTRSDKWRSLDYTKYNQIETVRNLSPYNGSCVYITHPGNCIVPGFEMTDPKSVKNTLIDVIFGAEVGNVQRFMILEHLQNLNFERLEIEEIMETYDEGEDLSDIVEKLDDIESKINKIILEIYGDLQVSRTPRLLFTSVFKTRIFKQMVESLHGWEFNASLMKLIDEIRDSLSRERESVKMRLDEEENSFLKNLQIVFVIGLVAQMITLFYAVDSFDFNLGTLFMGISVIASVVILWILKKLP
ncbi:MAG: hypothetical protein ACTSYI_15095 [Promethearchaeota archaeon]